MLNDARMARSLAALAIAVVIAATATVSSAGPLGKRNRKDKETSTSEVQTPSNADAGVVKNDFKATIAPEKQVDVHLNLARVYEAQGYDEAAVAEYQKAIEVADAGGRRVGASRTPGKVQALAHRRMAQAMDRQGRFSQAEVHYRTALRLSPNDAHVWNDAGYSYYLQRKWTDAERALKTAAKLSPQDQKIQTNLGLTLAAMGKTDAALEALTKAGGPAAAHANLGYLLASMGKNDAARNHYQTALQLQPQLEAARYALAKLEADGTRGISGSMPTSLSDRAIAPASATGTSRTRR
jgi:Flp pilus assembly protein TadD